MVTGVISGPRRLLLGLLAVDSASAQWPINAAAEIIRKPLDGNATNLLFSATFNNVA